MKALATVRKILSNDRHATRLLVRALVCASLGSLMLPIPIVVIWKMFTLFHAGETAQSFLGLGGVAFAAIVAYSVLTVGASANAHRAAFGLSTTISTALVEHIGRVPLHWLANISNGELKKRMSHDVNQIENFIAHNLTDLVAAVTLPSVTIPILFFVNWQLALIMLLIIVAASFVQFRAMTAMHKSNLMQEYFSAMGTLHGDAVEYVQGMPDIKIFNRSEESLSRMQVSINRFKEIQTKGRKLTLRPWTIFTTALSMPFAVLAVAGAYLHKYHQLPFEDVILFIVLGVVTFVPFKRLMRFVTFLWRASTGYSSVNQLLAVDVDQVGDRHRSEVLSADLAVNGLNVSYGDKQVLHDISFTAKEGTVTAIVGPSGAGKSTLAAAIAGLERIQGGTVTVGGIPLRDFAPGELSKVMSVVYQKPFVFSGTVRENICLGSESSSDEAMREAAAMVQCDTLINSFPDGYETRIGAGGSVYLSGGQTQRLALARMALRNAPVVLLDEATAFADPESEATIQKGLSNFLSDKTVLVIAHRLPSIARADNILVLDNGRIVESGTHETLMAKGALYSSMWNAYHTARSWMLTTDTASDIPHHNNQGRPEC
ncbi:ATP-binding cassette domain-containing protein [Pseudodesulfovibrio sp. F-1]|uniref:ATP-binding cassette domain-containing protein n=1 Tax=Pseudodesulfovibrio alkaliphilus TaxID=2661613 RepID=A0A7K1KQU7_9BACT|nr:ABC transporter ATP-binding protein [Pseudodesulfovibrio alkaliphilus]MUM78476.1 ATP-binding cassette domain-containing protein [Pseudodesulfovibrio alkaliphilus]